MKIGFFKVFFVAFIVLQAPVLSAAGTSELRAEADQYFIEHNFKKAYKIYYKLAKSGDHHSQGRVAQMYTTGEGRSIDLEEAYAWSVLAREGGEKYLAESSEVLLQRTDDKSAAQKKASKLVDKYGEEALKEKALRKAEQDKARRSGNSMGSNLSR
jgi:TPR repeat protein